MRLLLWGEKRGKNLPVLSSGFLLGKREGDWRGVEWRPKERKLGFFSHGESVANS